MMGVRRIFRDRWPATLSAAISTPRDLHVYARGVCHPGSEGTLAVSRTGPQGSHIFSSMVTANCIIHLPAGTASFAPGDQVEIEWFRW
jgi:molybdopterin molybdotransferase